MAEPIDWSAVPRTFADGGWFWLGDAGDKVLDAIAEDAADSADELSKAYRLTFQSPHGQRVLRDLIGKTLDQPTWVPGIADAIHAGFAREGQNSMVRYLIAQIGAQAHHAPAPTPQPPKETPNATETEPPVTRTASRDFTPAPDSPRSAKRKRSRHSR